MLDQVREALGVKTDPELARLLGLTRGAIWIWRRNGRIPAERRFELAALIAKRGVNLPAGLLDPTQSHKAA